MTHRLSRARCLCILLVFSFAARASAGSPLSFELTFSAKVHPEPFTGRVILFLSDDLDGQPRTKHSWTSRQPIFSKDVKDWKPGETLRIDDAAGFPCSMADLPPKEYSVQAVMHTNIDAPHSGTAPGNIYSKPVTFDLKAENPGPVMLKLNKQVGPPQHEDTARNKLVEIRSNLLSKFHRHDIFLRAIVLLPEGYADQPERKYPTLYIIPGFGGDHFQSAMMAGVYGKPSVPMVKVGLDGMWALGHHVFADSENMGPWGTALVEELIPHLEKEFRLIPEPRARLLTGHSSGGWGSLWVMITHPDFFGGTWSTSPDPVTFKDFCGQDLYDPATNFFTKSDGSRWPTMRRGKKILLYTQDEVTNEDVIGPGGQFASFEAVFSPRGRDGKPRQLFDRKTGKIDPETIQAWRKYDIVEKLRTEWPTLGPKLKGKITIIMGEEDTFYLEGATKILKQEMEKLGSDARIILVPGKDHSNIMFSDPFRNMIKEMSARFEDEKSPSSAPAEKH